MWKSILLFLMLYFLSVLPLKAQGLLGPFNRDQLLQGFEQVTVGENKSPVFGKGKLLLLVFLSPECPFSKNYSVVIQNIARAFSKDLVVLGVVPGSVFSTQDVVNFVKQYHLEFPFVLDEKKALVHGVKASITPEVVLLDEEARLLYRGAIDDWAVSLGKTRTTATKHYLEDAIRLSLSGQRVVPTIIQPIGCFIDEF